MARKGLTVGRSAVDFQLGSTLDRSISLADYQGQPIVIVFLRGTW